MVKNFNIAALFMCLTASACATVETTKQTPKDISGIAYFLPKRMTKVTAKRLPANIDKAVKAVAAAELAVAASKKTLSSAETSLEEIEAILKSPALSDEYKKEYVIKKEDKIKAKAAARKDFNTKKAKLEKAKEALEKAKEDTTSTECKTEINFVSGPAIADRSQAYYLNPKHSLLRDDKHKIAVNSKGLLSTLNVEAADRTIDILTELAALAGGVTDQKNENFTGSPLPCVTATADMLVDMSGDLENLNKMINEYGYHVQKEDSNATPNKPGKGPFKGILYRTPVDVLFNIQKCGTPCKEEKVHVKTIALSLPQAGPISYVKQKAGPFTKTTYDLVFKDGSLSNYTSSRPSEIAEFVAIPNKVINGFFKGASQVLSLRIDQNNQLAKLSDSELTMLQSQIGLTTGENSALTGLSASQLALLRSNLELQAIEACINEQIENDGSTEICLEK